MPDDMNGSAPDTAPVALLLVDTINDLEFPGGEELLEQARPMARAIAGLRSRARAAGFPCVYVNDNFGRWRSDFRQTIGHVLGEGVRGRPVAELLRPGQEDYFVLKPRHSGFFGTSLDLLLGYLGARTLIVTGMAADSCVQATAADAYMRGYRLLVPADCVASESAERSRCALAHMATVLKADTSPSAGLDLAAIAEGAG